MFLEGFTPYKEEDAKKYNRLRYWAGLTFGDILDKKTLEEDIKQKIGIL